MDAIIFAVYKKFKSEFKAEAQPVKICTVRVLLSACSLTRANYRKRPSVFKWRQRGPVVNASDSQCGGPWFESRSGACFSKVLVTVLCLLCFHSRKLSVNEAKLTGLWARNCATIQQVLILKFAFGPEKFSSLSRNGPLATCWICSR